MGHPTSIHQWKRALLEGAHGVFERRGREAPEVDEERVKGLQAEIRELAVANDFLARKFKPWTGKRSARSRASNAQADLMSDFIWRRTISPSKQFASLAE